jgi:hypothetical protein
MVSLKQYNKLRYKHQRHEKRSSTVHSDKNGLCETYPNWLQFLTLIQFISFPITCMHEKIQDV